MSTVYIRRRRLSRRTCGIRAGEQLLMINHHEIVDVLDYRFFCYDPSVSLRLREADGTTQPPDESKRRRARISASILIPT